MPVAEIGPAFFRFDADEMRVQIAIRLLGLFHPVDQFIHEGFHFGIRKLRKGITDRLDELGDVGIPEDMRRIRHAGLPLKFPCVDTPRVLALAIFDGQRVFAVDRLAFLPEAAGDGDVFKRKEFHDFT